MSELDELRGRIHKLEEENERIKNAMLELCQGLVHAAAAGTDVPSDLPSARSHLDKIKLIIREVAEELYPSLKAGNDGSDI